MELLRRMLRQKAVYWPMASGYDNYGNPINSNPVQISCRWVDREDQFLDKEGRLQISRAMVYVSQPVVLGGVLWLGLLANINISGKWTDNVNAWEIRKINNDPKFRNQASLLWVYL